jgi:hypothetical protein
LRWVQDSKIDGEILLHRAVRKGDDGSYMYLLLDNGASLLIKDDRGRNAVHGIIEAYRSAHIQQIFDFLERRHPKGSAERLAILNAVDTNGFTPLGLVFAEKFNQIPLEHDKHVFVKKLLDLGADPSMPMGNSSPSVPTPMSILQFVESTGSKSSEMYKTFQNCKALKLWKILPGELDGKIPLSLKLPETAASGATATSAGAGSWGVGAGAGVSTSAAAIGAGLTSEQVGHSLSEGREAKIVDSEIYD